MSDGRRLGQRSSYVATDDGARFVRSISLPEVALRYVVGPHELLVQLRAGNVGAAIVDPEVRPPAFDAQLARVRATGVPGPLVELVPVTKSSSSGVAAFLLAMSGVLQVITPPTFESGALRATGLTAEWFRCTGLAC